MVKLITYTDERMTISAQKLRESALKFGVDQVKIYTPADMDDTFKEVMKDVLACERGAGFYCWKPYVVYDAIKHMEKGDILIWSDAGTIFIDNVYRLIDSMDDDVLFFSNGWPHVDWCKMDTLKHFFKLYPIPGEDITSAFDQDTKNEIDARKQVQASHIVFKATDRGKTIAAHWLHETITNPHLIDNTPSVLPNIKTFSEHRWDQSILCCLQIMYGVPLHWFPSTYGFHIKDAHPNDRYPAMFEHHRKRNNEW